MARQYRTLGELRAEMRALLGFGSTGAAAGPNQTIIDTHLRRSQVLLYWAHDWAHLRKYGTKTLGLNAYLLDYPTAAAGGYDCQEDRVKAISVLIGTVWTPAIPKGITPQLYTTQSSYGQPQRWEPYDQIEFWPKSDQAYSIRIFGMQKLAELTADAHRFTIDDDLVGIVALASLKAHYRQPDAQLHQQSADVLLAKLKAKSWGQSVFRPDDYADATPMVKPQTEE